MLEEKPRKVNGTATQPESSEDVPTATGREDTVLDHLHRCVDGQGAQRCGQEEARHIHEEFAACEAYQTYLLYEEGSMPTIADFNQGVETVLANMSHSHIEGEAEERVIRMLRGRNLQIQGAVKRYVESVVIFNRKTSGTARFRLEPADLQKIDSDRRRLHNNLLTTLESTAKTLREAIDLGIFPEASVGWWQPGTNARALPGQIVFFAPNAIANRDLIRNWAIAADFSKSFHHLEDLIKESPSL